MGNGRRLSRLRDVVGGTYDVLRLLPAERRSRWSRFRQAHAGFSSDRVEMGRHTYGSPLIATFPGDTARVRIGSFTSIALDVVLMDGGNHRLDWVTTFPLRARLGLRGAYADGHPSSKGDIEIGNDVWIGMGACVMSGVKIGNGAVVAGRSVVAKDVRPYAIVAGNPAREIRRRFSDEQIDALERIAWWDWPQEKILECVCELSSENLDRFIAAHLPHA
jgi:acetyltransferase-like isoleucine patch superfamily enzyme